MNKRFPCTYPGCTKGYDYQCYLKRHNRNHTGEKMQCQWCPAKLLHQQTYNVHKNDFHTSGTYICPECSEIFESWWDLKEHMKLFKKEHIALSQQNSNPTQLGLVSSQNSTIPPPLQIEIHQQQSSSDAFEPIPNLQYSQNSENSHLSQFLSTPLQIISNNSINQPPQDKNSQQVQQQAQNYSELNNFVDKCLQVNNNSTAQNTPFNGFEYPYN